MSDDNDLDVERLCRYAQRWVETYTKRLQAEAAHALALSAVSDARRAQDEAESALRPIVSGNDRKRLISTQHGFVLVSYQGSTNNTVELLPAIGSPLSAPSSPNQEQP